MSSLLDTIDGLGNPFEEDSGDLYSLESKKLMGTNVIASITNVMTTGEEQYNHFVYERFEERSKPISEHISKNKLPLFKTPTCQTQSKLKKKVTTLKSDC